MAAYQSKQLQNQNHVVSELEHVLQNGLIRLSMKSNRLPQFDYVHIALEKNNFTHQTPLINLVICVECSKGVHCSDSTDKCDKGRAQTWN